MGCGGSTLIFSYIYVGFGIFLFGGGGGGGKLRKHPPFGLAPLLIPFALSFYILSCFIHPVGVRGQSTGFRAVAGSKLVRKMSSAGNI